MELFTENFVHRNLCLCYNHTVTNKYIYVQSFDKNINQNFTLKILFLTRYLLIRSTYTNQISC